MAMNFMERSLVPGPRDAIGNCPRFTVRHRAPDRNANRRWARDS